jgi:toxin secretion/phage lysis holin
MRAEINLLTIIVGIAGYVFGGWTLILQTLVFFMAVDYCTGVIAACFRKSKKSRSGGLSSKAGFKGLLKKVFILVIAAVAYRIDKLIGAEGLVYNAALLFYISNEAISIIENVSVLGLPVPAKLINVIDSLKEDNNDEG